MRFNPKARLDSRQVEVRRGGRGGGGFGGGFGDGFGRGSGVPIPMGVGGGVGGVILLIVVLVLSGAFSEGGRGSSSGQTGDTTGVSGVPNCQTGDDANKNEQCALVADVNSIQSFWDKALPDQADIQYRPVPTVFFTGQTDPGCGGATSDVGPFY